MTVTDLTKRGFPRNQLLQEIDRARAQLARTEAEQAVAQAAKAAAETARQQAHLRAAEASKPLGPRFEAVLRKAAQTRATGKPLEAPVARRALYGEALVVRLWTMASTGLLDLSRPGTELVGLVGAVDLAALVHAMGVLGYTQVLRGIPSILYWRR
jgi:multidrug efflux pump subunit AcrA (membrane-fusion protein)